MTSSNVNNAAYSSRKAASKHVKRAGLHRLVDSVSTMCEEGLGFGPRQRRATVGDGVIKGGFCPRLAQMGFELGEELLDRIEVRRVGGVNRIEAPAARQLPRRRGLVRGEIGYTAVWETAPMNTLDLQKKRKQDRSSAGEWFSALHARPQTHHTSLKLCSLLVSKQ